MNRQERHAYEMGKTAANLGLPLEVVTDPEERSEARVMRAPAFVEHARMGYRDAVCTCGHLEGEHLDGFGCREEAKVEGFEGIECPCTAFQSAGVQKRLQEAQSRAEVERARREGVDPEAPEEVVENDDDELFYEDPEFDDEDGGDEEYA